MILELLRKTRLFDIIASIVHFTVGVITGFSLILWRDTGDPLILIFTALMFVFFHIYELIEWKIIRDDAYDQLLEFYLGFSLVYVTYLAGVVLNG